MLRLATDRGSTDVLRCVGIYLDLGTTTALVPIETPPTQTAPVDERTSAIVAPQARHPASRACSWAVAQVWSGRRWALHGGCF